MNLQTMLDREKKQIRLFKYAIERIPTDNYTLILNSMAKPKTAHPGRYNSPTSDEVAVIIEEGNADFRQISLCYRGGNISHEIRQIIGHENRDLHLPLRSKTAEEVKADREHRPNNPLSVRNRNEWIYDVNVEYNWQWICMRK